MNLKTKNKKGLSPLVASVLLILLVLVLALIIFLWAKGFLTERIEKFGQPVEKICPDVLFDIQRVQGTSSAHAIEVINRGNVDIHKIDLKLEKGGNSEVARFEFSIFSGQTTKEDTYLKMKNGIDPEKITAYPAIIGQVRGANKNKAFTCLDQGIVVNL